MKYFAITPDTCTPEHVTTQLLKLRDRHVSFLYLRSPLLYNDDVRTLVSAVHAAGIVPLIPYLVAEQYPDIRCGVHFKSGEHHVLMSRKPWSDLLITASSHESAQARMLLEGPAHYVFISPVYQPLSKPGSRQALIPLQHLRELTACFGERVVLLGGMTPHRIQELRKELGDNFSVAGISMFFGTADENNT